MATAFNAHTANDFLDRSKVYLIVDNLETMRKITIGQLRQLGAEKVLSARDGGEALRILRSQRVDVIISDRTMPVMNGLALLRAVRSDERLRELPFLMVTAEADRSRVERAVASGVTSILLKPYAPVQLLARIERALAAKSSDTEDRPTRARVSRPDGEQDRLTLLLVDDSQDNLTLLSELFKDDYRLKIALNGAKALEICQSDDPPDLVLLDVMMPIMDGFEVAERMRRHPHSEAIPIIFLTAMNSEEARRKGMDLGAVDFITKPYEPHVLKMRVSNFMRYVQMRRELQADFDNMVEHARMREDIENMARHDVKGQLSGVLNLVQGLMADDALSPRQMEQIKLMEESMLQVMETINLSSELYKIETGRFKTQAAAVDVGSLLRRLVEIQRTAFASENIAISVDTDVPLGQPQPKARGEAMLCYSIFQNLLKTACEAAPSGTKVEVKLYDRDPLCIEITRRGVVPMAKRERFFEKFANDGASDDSGMGTYSARLMAQAQGGSVVLKVSDEEDTTCLSITLPRALGDSI